MSRLDPAVEIVFEAQMLDAAAAAAHKLQRFDPDPEGSIPRLFQTSGPDFASYFYQIIPNTSLFQYRSNHIDSIPLRYPIQINFYAGIFLDQPIAINFDFFRAHARHDCPNGR